MYVLQGGPRRAEEEEGGGGCAVYRGSRAKGVGLCSRNLTGGRLSDGCAPPLRNRIPIPEKAATIHPLLLLSPIITRRRYKGPALTTTNRLPQMTPPLAIHLADLSAQGTSGD
ncbi:hypothetical protein CEXT_15271 [Caerostris extrusa]|uniref:Uncharacterized protein n=1 Tax=Caerostris extrusa TaxID=172846 RepID=A0AAV4NE65_CAEEX|nr:hypothetical protein CEXT_15271 [Caerostris extrusa]